MAKRLIFYGMASGIMLVLLFALYFLATENVCEVYGSVPMWGYGFILLSFLWAIPAAYRYGRRRKSRGFTNVFGVALGVCLISSVIFSLYAFIHFDTPEVEEDAIYTGCDALGIEYEGMGKEAIGLEFLRPGTMDNNFGNAWAQTGWLFVLLLIIALIVSLGAAVIVNNLPKQNQVKLKH